MRRFCRGLTPLLLTVMLVLAGCSESPAPVSSGDDDKKPSYPVTWRFALEEIEGSVQHRYALEFKDRIERISDGNILVDIFPYGSIGTSTPTDGSGSGRFSPSRFRFPRPPG